MPYTQSQLRYLNGMGIVPWIERSIAQSDAGKTLCDALVAAEKPAAKNHVPSATTSATTSVTETATAQVVAPTATGKTATVQTSAIAEPADALNTNTSTHELDQATVASQPNSESHAEPTDFMQTPLVEMPFRGKRCTQLGKSDAPLLILVEANSTQQNQYPFEPADAKIFDDMLRAIAWRRQDVCLGVLPPSSAPSLLVDNNEPSVSDLCIPHRDAVLLFRQSVPETHNVDELIVPLAREGMLAWQLPHPALLRESPQRKRQAWNVLKAARARLG